ncbi:MAG: hypothetical protein QM278_04275 [Pseudomonadota bacterium]|nr:hypothetical protein [Pseudomonadota bacterium]
MGEAVTENRESETRHRWRFFRAGGFDQVRLESGQDLKALDQLDQKLWVALSCPVAGLEFDRKTLELIDTDHDGRIRAPEIVAAVSWATAMLKNPNDLLKRAAELPLEAIDDLSEEGRRLLSSAKQILATLGKDDATVITPTDTADTKRIFAQARFNGDGIITPEAAGDEELARVIAAVMECCGSDMDRSGQPGIGQEKVGAFYADLQAYAAWHGEAVAEKGILPLGKDTEAAFGALSAVRVKVDDYFARCRLAAFDSRALDALNRREEEYIAIAKGNLNVTAEEIAGFPLALITADRTLPLREGLNPAWEKAVAAFAAAVATPLLGTREKLTEAEWVQLQAAFAAYEDWLSRKPATAVEGLGIERILEILAGRGRAAIEDLQARDRAVAPEFTAIADVDRLVRYHRDLIVLLKNFVSFSDFYTRKEKALFQAGVLYLDGRGCDLCVRVDDIARHASLATMSQTYLAYCHCKRKTEDGADEEMDIAAAFTDGDADCLMPGRNGIFYDRRGRDWDATIVKVIEHPISIRQAFWSPYKRIARMIGEQIEKMAASRDREFSDTARTGLADGAKAMEDGKTAPGKPPFDVAKFAGIFAALGLAVGAIGTALAAAITGFMKLIWWQMPLAVGGLMLVISGPSVVIAWLKLRQRTLGPILDANGWAVNARARINIPFGGALTKVAVLPPGAERSLEDPFAEKKSLWPKLLLLLVVILLLLYLFVD